MKVDRLPNFGYAASTLVESRSLEAEIADRCRAICWATEPHVAMSYWVRLRNLTAQKTTADNIQFIRETKNGELTRHTP